MAARHDRGTVIIPPLREIKLNSRPYAMRALDFSCDGELAVAGDDSVHIFVPEFPDPVFAESQPEKDDMDEETKWTQVIGRRAQYSQGNKQFLVSRPPVHPRVNEELFEAAGITFPYGKTVAKGKSKAAAHDSDDSSEAAETDSQASSNTPFGAGFGPIVGSGSSMNHIISLRWSPPGLGVNRRPVLAVMTSRGTLVMYGDRVATASLGMSKVSDGMLVRRNLDSWSILWGVGERLVVPGQQTETSEAIKGFAWAKEVGPGQGLVAYITDQKEVAIISVQAAPPPKKDVNGKKNERYGDEDKIWESDVVWNVYEVARFNVQGPHPDPSRTDPNWTPFGTAFALAFSPWLRHENSRSCLLSYIDRGYIGFRRITLETPWVLGKLPQVIVDETDTKGECVHNSSDSFFEFEDAIWTKKIGEKGDIKGCRGILNTGFHIKAIEVSISGGPKYEVTPHKTDVCGTTYNDERTNRPNTNPIIDLVVHPPDLTRPTEMPIYTLVRASATHTNDNWFETNAPMPDNPAATRPQPRWVTELRQKLGKTDTIDVLPQMFAKTAMDEDEPNSEDSQSEEEDGDALEDLPGKSLGAHDQRFRFYGLTASVGGGMSAVLVMPQATKGPDRDNWHTRRTSVLFDSKPPPQRLRPDAYDGETPRPAPVIGRSLTTEARMMEYMYGAGPEVSGVVTSAAENQDKADDIARTREALQELFHEAVNKQTCDIDGRPLERVDDGWECGRHVWGICGTSGLAIMVIGVARVCAVCGSRTLPLEMLARKLPKDKWAEMEALAAGDTCGRCGGKFLN